MAALAGTVTLSMPKLISTLTLRVRFARVASARLWLASRVMQLAGVIARCDVEIEVQDGGAEERALRRVLG